MKRRASCRFVLERGVPVAAGLVVLGCTGEIGALPGRSPDGGPGAGRGVGPGEAPGPARPGEDGGGATLACSGGPNAGSAPLRRLTRAEYTRAVRDVFGVTTDAAAAFAPDERIGGVFASNVESAVASVQTRQFLEAAEAVSAALDVERLVACDRAASGDEACARAFVERIGRRAYRRPLAPDETARYLDTYRTLREVDDFDTAVRVLAQAMMQSPHFLYHLELDGPEAPAIPDGVSRLPAFALASRLSFLFWGSVPDDALLDGAEAGLLDTEEGVLAEARRLLEDPRARDAVAEFHASWLGLDRLDHATRDPAQFPSFGPDLVAAIREEAGAFADHVIRVERGDLAALFGRAVSFPEGPARSLLGPGEGTDRGGGRFELDPAKRAGILTQPAFLAAHSHSDQTSPILRGRAVRERFLCQPLGDPPPNVVARPPPLDPTLTTRERFAEHRTTGSACAYCHEKIDDLGFALEHFDALGRYRATENGRAIDASGVLTGTDVDGPMNGAVELAARLGRSSEARDCYARQWFRYALGRAEEEADACSLASLEKDGTIRELLLSLATSDTFVHRRTGE